MFKLKNFVVFEMTLVPLIFRINQIMRDDDDALRSLFKKYIYNNKIINLMRII